jgi:hypothetical protein
MALHGTIAVNGGEISRWWAVRREGTFTDGHFAYDCGWISGGITTNFVVQHRYNDGAETLAMKVLEAIPQRQQRASKEAP